MTRMCENCGTSFEAQRIGRPRILCGSPQCSRAYSNFLRRITYWCAKIRAGVKRLDDVPSGLVRRVLQRLSLVFLLFLLGCGRSPFEKVNDNPAVQFARAAASAHFNIELTNDVFRYDNKKLLQSLCKDARAVACFSTFGIIRISAQTPHGTCTQALHEFGHAALFRLYNDLSHDRFPDFFKSTVFNVCEAYAQP